MNPPEPSGTYVQSRWITWGLPGSVAAACLVVLGLYRFPSLQRHGESVASWTTAAGVLAVGLALLVRRWPRGGWLADALLVFAVLLGAGTALECSGDLSTGIVALWPAAAVSGASPGMAGNAALGVAASALAILALERPPRWTRIVAEAVLGLIIVSGLAALVGYIHQVGGGGEGPLLRRFAAVTLSLLATSAMLAHPERGFAAEVMARSGGGFMARRMLIGAALLPMLLAWFAEQTKRRTNLGFATVDALLVIALMVCFALLAWGVALWLNRAERAREMAAEQLREQTETLETLNRTSQALVAELDLGRLAQRVVEAATQLSGASSGAFFYHRPGELTGSFERLAYCGASSTNFASLPRPALTSGIFRVIFVDKQAVVSDDVQRDTRVRIANRPMPVGHFDVRSFLGVPVVSRSGEILGGLLFGHPDPGVFGLREERLVRSLAAQSAVALDNAILYSRAQEAIEARDRFISIASHELKTPLTTLALHTQVAARRLARGEPPSPERMRRFTDAGKRQLDRLGRVVDDMLDVSRINSGRLALELEPVDLATLAGEILDRFTDELAGAECAVTRELAPGVVGNWDRYRLDQVLTNLLTNAMKYGRGKPVIVGVSAADGRARLWVRDQGIGIATSDKRRIFEAFERAVPPGSIAGLGLGLFIVQSIVHAHGGTIAVESEPGRGSTFSVDLPVEAASAQPKPPPTMAVKFGLRQIG